MLKDRKVRMAGIPVVAFIMSLSINGAEFWTHPFAHFLQALVFTAVLWEGNRAIFIISRKLFPKFKTTFPRILFQVLSMVLFTIGSSVALDALFYFVNLSDCQPEEWLGIALINLIPSVIIMLIYESAYFFNRWKEYIQQTEMLARENIYSQLEVLKNQVDPHFLFNSLNTLSALIEPDNESAQEYLSRLSDVYRYVLSSKDKTTVSLQEELQFVDAYLHLNKVRFRENLTVEKSINYTEYHKRVAPLSVQMLVENAIKHNVVSSEQPLNLQLLTESNHIIVKNNLQQKGMKLMKEQSHSTHTGLKNIISRYTLMTSAPVEVNRSSETFEVKIPLISK
jgi:two-component system, LytTR family, sensor kinase